ncbi:hypothetical protein Slin15195_G023720 [Septoria linicola]|uniref:Mid2 domain-containing protein n=1 Tax=Septoria linicola TaxID=215465 RepID=A0A9Q9EH85_9PEZI|nr:hypothetical protein Slin14017_G022800 [Septoria linicola]USW49053.1 hypothetical protein Slin15195_G023720 [Septoria linicola]
MKLLHAAGFIACASNIALAVVNELNSWQYPGPAGGANILWTIGIDRPLKWYTELTEYNITLWQNRAGTFPLNVGAIWQSTENNNAGNISYTWKVDPMSAELKNGENFFLWGGWQCQDQPGCDEPDEGFTSWSFNLTYLQPSEISSTAIATATPTGAPTGTTNTSLASATADSSSTSTDTANNNNKNNDDHKDNSVTIGAAVGGAVGGLLLLGLGVFFGMRIAKRRARRDRQTSPGMPMLSDSHDHDYDHEHGVVSYRDEQKMRPTHVQSFELPSESPAELPAGDGKPRELGA